MLAGLGLAKRKNLQAGPKLSARLIPLLSTVEVKVCSVHPFGVKFVVGSGTLPFELTSCRAQQMLALFRYSALEILYIICTLSLYSLFIRINDKHSFNDENNYIKKLCFVAQSSDPSSKVFLSKNGISG